MSSVQAVDAGKPEAGCLATKCKQKLFQNLLPLQDKEPKAMLFMNTMGRVHLPITVRIKSLTQASIMHIDGLNGWVQANILSKHCANASAASATVSGYHSRHEEASSSSQSLDQTCSPGKLCTATRSHC